MVLAGNKSKSFSSVNHSTKTIHYHHHICIHHIHIYICICNHYFRFSSSIIFTICVNLSIVMCSSNTSFYCSISCFKYNSFSFSHFQNKFSSTSCSFFHREHRISCLQILLKLFFKGIILARNLKIVDASDLDSLYISLVYV